MFWSQSRDLDEGSTIDTSDPVVSNVRSALQADLSDLSSCETRTEQPRLPALLPWTPELVSLTNFTQFWVNRLRFPQSTLETSTRPCGYRQGGRSE